MTSWSIMIDEKAEGQKGIRAEREGAKAFEPFLPAFLPSCLPAFRMSSIDLAEHDVNRSDQRDDVGDQVALHEPAQSLQVAERRRTDAEPIRIRRLADGYEEIPVLALRRSDRVVRLARRRLDQSRNLADDRTLGNALRRLPDDLERLPEFLHAHEIPIVGVAGHADGDVELHLVVRGVRLVLAHVARDAGSAQRRTAETEADRFRTRDDADAARPLEPDAVVRQQLFVLVDLRVHDAAELQDLLVEAGRDVERQAADAHRVVREPRAAELLS